MIVKYFAIALGAAIILGIAWWLISPVWRTVTLDEALPHIPAASAPAIRDNLNTMDAETHKRFLQETATMKDHMMMGAEPVPAATPAILAQASMVARAHDVAGKALLIQSGDQKIIRFENLDTINGPDLRIYLSAGLNADDFVDLGPIRATRGNVNYPVPPDTDTSKYRNVLIWCRAFGVLFSYAVL